jgi:hypothetical protein
MTFSYTRFPVNKINVEKNFKFMRKLLFNYSFYSHPEIGKFQGVTWTAYCTVFDCIDLFSFLFAELSHASFPVRFPACRTCSQG